MREAHPRERAFGVEWYVSTADGVGGRLKVDPEDFRVRELEAFETEPLDADPGPYPHVVFRATLRNWDTNDFADAVSKKLGISRERVSWGGTKDKRAVTTQLFSVKGIDPKDLPELGGADVELVGRAGRPILFGDLAGNAFDITVREPDAPANAEDIAAELHAFAGGERAGVPNFFGPQRFGSYRPVTHEVGLDIVRGSWEDAVMTYVTTTSEDEPETSREVREFVAETRDWQEALERLPGQLRYERSMLHALAENGGETEADFREALERLPSNLQQLLVHAAQSYAFNLMLSERVERGLPFERAVAGDVVCFADRAASAASRERGDGPVSASEAVELPDPNRTQRVSAGRLDTINRHCDRGRAFVTAPLVGTETEFADGEQGDIERAVMDDLGLAPEDFDRPGEFGSTGTRRAILVRTDLDVERDPLSFSFSLPKGSYATTVLREFMKTDPVALT